MTTSNNEICFSVMHNAHAQSTLFKCIIPKFSKNVEESTVSQNPSKIQESSNKTDFH